jgi:hypothetical protein
VGRSACIASRTLIGGGGCCDLGSGVIGVGLKVAGHWQESVGGLETFEDEEKKGGREGNSRIGRKRGKNGE